MTPERLEVIRDTAMRCDLVPSEVVLSLVSEVKKYHDYIDATIGTMCGTCGFKYKMADVGTKCHCGGEVLDR